MRTYFEIIDAAKHGQKPTHDECYYVMLVQSALLALDSNALRSMLREGVLGKKEIMEAVVNESFNRNKRALNADPQKWLGDNIPGNPSYDRFLRISEDILNKIMNGYQPRAEIREKYARPLEEGKAEYP